jgi:ABC-type polysaccharide/polyol phosphate transport system ATPase subunit
MPMPAEPIISVHQVSKIYRIWENPSNRLSSSWWRVVGELAPAGSSWRASMSRRAKRGYRDFHALRDLSLEVLKGESVGLIGRNGSGKSTLLQIIAGTLQPTAGSVKVNGRVAALLELGSGFNPDFTGKENVFLNAAVLGLSRAQIQARYDAIASFAEIGQFIDEPVRTYSSGMVVRLAFAVAAHVDPDILIVDEALSVGDARFQLKCARAIDRFIAQGATLLFVSHDASMVKRLCRRALLLEHGGVVYAGAPNDVVNLYSKLIDDCGSVEALAPDIAALQASSSPPAEPGPASPAEQPAAETAGLPMPASHPASCGAPGSPAEIASLRLRLKAAETVLRAHPDAAGLARKIGLLLADERLHVQVSGKEFAYGGELGRIRDVGISDAEGQARTWFTTSEAVVVRMLVEALEDFPDPIFALTVKNTAGVEIYGTNTLFGEQPAQPIKSHERREVTFSFDIDLLPGDYFLSFGFTHFIGDELVVIHRRYDAIKIEVHGVDRSFGIANLRAVIRSQTPSVTGGEPPRAP